MARTATPTELDVLADNARTSALRVRVQNVDGTWKELTDLSGTGFSDADFVQRATITDDSDAPTWTGTIELAESVVVASGASVSIAPDVETSPANVDDASAYAPLIDGMRRVDMYSTTGRLDGSDATEHKVFDGYVVSTSQQGGLKMAIADLGYLLLTTQVEDERVYGTDDGVPLDTVIQQILDDNMGAGVIPLAVDTASFGVDGVPDVKKFNFGRPRLLTGIRDLAINTVGANVRYLWDGEDMVLTLFMPPRDKVTADFTLSADNYEPKPSWDRNTEDVRNAGRCYFRDRDKKTVAYVSGSVPTSITRYKRRYFEFKEAATSQVDTPEEAQRFLDLALQDLAFPKAEKKFTTHLMWAFGVYDLFEMVANGNQYTTNQLQGVQRVTHTWGTARETRTAFETRGTIAGYTKNWIIREGDGPRPVDIDTLFLALGMGGEATMYGGELFGGETNGCVWPFFFAGKNIRRIHIWARENDPGTLVPQWPPTGSDTFKAGTIERPEGTKSTEGNFVWPGFGAAVDPDDPYNDIKFWRIAQPIPTGRNGQAVIRTVIVKPETFDGTFGKEERLVVTTADIGTPPSDFVGTPSITRVDPTTIEFVFTLPSGYAGVPVYMRDGVTIEVIDIGELAASGGGSGLGPYTYRDPGLHADKTYQISVFMFNSNQSGARTQVTIDPWGTSFGFTATTDFSFGGPRVRLDLAGVPGGTTVIEVRKSKDSGQYDPWTVAARLAPADFPYYDAVVKAGQYYQLWAYNGSTLLDKTLPFFWRSPLPLVTGPA